MSKLTCFFYIIIALFIHVELFGQTKISGYVVDQATNEALINAHVWSNKNQVAQVTNGYGYFLFTINKNIDTLELFFSYTGYKQNSVLLVNLHDTVFVCRLKSDNLLHDVDVIASNNLNIEQRNQVSMVSIPQRDIQMLPTIAGERDIAKAYQLMPGAQGGYEGSSALYVRGGTPDQNLMLLDDVPIYYVNHLGGFASIFNDDAINSSKLIKGGFPSQYGGRLSSVFDVKMKEGNSKKHSSALSIGLLTSKIMFEGPLKKDTSSYLISVRRFMYDLLTMPVTKLATGNTSLGYTFWDTNLKWNYKFSDKNRLFFSAYVGDDKIFFKNDEDNAEQKFKAKYSEKWGNIMSALRWNHVFSGNVFGNFITSFTRYRYLNTLNCNSTENNENTESLSSFYSSISDVSFNPKIEWYLSNYHKLVMGGVATAHFFKPGINSKKSYINGLQMVNDVDKVNLQAFEHAVFIEDQFSTNNGFNGNIGIRLSGYNVNSHFYNFFEPRVMIGYTFGKSQINTSFSRTQQAIHLLVNSGAGIPIEFWVPATEKAPPSVSSQVTLGFVSSVFPNVEITVETYLKKMERLITFKEGATYFGSDKKWDEKIETNGIGKVYGAEFLLQKKQGKYTGWIAYTWSKNLRQFDGINNGNIYAYKFDRRHNVSIVSNIKISEKIDMGITWVFGSGQAITLPESKYFMPNIKLDELDLDKIYSDDMYDEEAQIYSGVSNYRTKPYHRLDIGFNFRKEKHRGTRTWSLSVYNVYNQANPFYYFLSTGTKNGVGKVSVMQKSLFPIMPSVSYSFRFK